MKYDSMYKYLLEKEKKLGKFSANNNKGCRKVCLMLVVVRLTLTAAFNSKNRSCLFSMLILVYCILGKLIYCSFPFV